MVDKLLESELNSIPEADFIDLAAEDVTDLQKDIDSQMDKIFQEFGGDTNDVEFKINVRRSIPNRGETEHCFSCLPSELPITDRIKEEYGSGAYEIWIYKAGKIFKRRKLNIAKALKQPILNPVNNNNDVSQLILAMSENNRQNMEQIKTLIAPSAKPPMDILQMVTVGTTLITALKEVLIPPVQSNPMETFMQAATFMNDMKSEGSKESNGFDMIGKLAQTFGPGIMDMSNKLAAHQPRIPAQLTQPAQPAETPTQPIQPTNQTAVTSMPDQLTQQELGQLKQQLGMLVQMAHGGKDSALYADLIMDQVPEEYINKYILRPDVIPFLISVEPNIEHFKEWFVELHKHIDAAFTDDDIPVLTDDEETAKTTSITEPLTVDNEIEKVNEKDNSINAASKQQTENQTGSDSSGNP